LIRASWQCRHLIAGKQLGAVHKVNEHLFVGAGLPAPLFQHLAQQPAPRRPRRIDPRPQRIDIHRPWPATHRQLHQRAIAETPTSQRGNAPSRSPSPPSPSASGNSARTTPGLWPGCRRD
jgi:hypothetical protein